MPQAHWVYFFLQTSSQSFFWEALCLGPGSLENRGQGESTLSHTSPGRIWLQGNKDGEQREVRPWGTWWAERARPGCHRLTVNTAECLVGQHPWDRKCETMTSQNSLLVAGRREAAHLLYFSHFLCHMLWPSLCPWAVFPGSCHRYKGSHSLHISRPVYSSCGLS